MWHISLVSKDVKSVLVQLRKNAILITRQNWRSYLVKIDADGRLAWEATNSFSFLEEENCADLPSTASEWVY